VIWQNRSFNVVVTQPATGALQSTVSLVPSFNQTSTGQCFNSSSTYWDLGLRGDTGPGDHSSGVTFDPKASVITSIGGYPGGGAGFRANTASFGAGVVSQYCNGSKRPPEAHCTDANTGASIPCGYSVPPGTNESNVPNPIFSLTAGATVDEANNWVSISWGPLAMTNPQTNAQLGDYSLAPGSQAINYITPVNSSTTYTAAPTNDFFDRSRKSNNAVDAGAVEFAAAANTPGAALTPTSRIFGNATRGVGTLGAPTQVFLLTNTGNATLTGIGQAALGGTNPTEFSIVRLLSTCGPAGGGQLAGQTTLAPGAACIVTVQFRPLTTQPTGVKTATVSVTDVVGTQTSTLTGTAQ